MADLVFNIAKGKVNEYVNRVAANDPANSALVVALFTGAGSDATLRDLDTLAAIEADAGFAEASDVSYARKILTDADLSSPTPDDTNDRQESDIPDQTWALLAGGENITRLIVCYDSDTTGGTDANIVPLTAHDFVTTTDGSNVTAEIDAAGFYRAS